MTATSLVGFSGLGNAIQQATEAAGWYPARTPFRGSGQGASYFQGLQSEHGDCAHGCWCAEVDLAQAEDAYLDTLYATQEAAEVRARY